MAAGAKIVAMQPALLAHPDRAAATLATIEAERDARGSGPFLGPGPGARDCRIDLKLLAWQARQACHANPAATARLSAFDADEHRDLWAGTVRDGTARGFATVPSGASTASISVCGSSIAASASASGSTPK